MTVWIWTGKDERLLRLESDAAIVKWGARTASSESWHSVSSSDAVIDYCLTKPIDEEKYKQAWVLNPNAYLSSRWTAEEKQRIWRQWGVNRKRTPLASVRRFRVSVVHMDIAAIERIDGKYRSSGTVVSGSAANGRGGAAHYRQRENAKPPGEGRRKGASDFSGGLFTGVHAAVGRSHNTQLAADDPMLRRIAQAAIRALYALGLDIGEVELELGGDGAIDVRDAWPGLNNGEAEGEALARFAAWHDAARAEDQRQLLIGADPEFVLVTPSGRIAAASRFFGEGVGGAAGSDALRIGRRVLYPVAELRPAPAADPAALAAHLRRLLLRAAAKVSDPSLRWVAGAMPVPGLALGGHIHISGAPLTTRLLRLLDSFAAIPLALIEDPAGRARRPRYGSLGDYRLQPHGGFEYRTLPSWLVSPAAAKSAFALALLCAREQWTLRHIPALDEQYIDAYFSGDRSTLAGSLDGIAAALTATASYKVLSRYIDPLLDAAKQGKTWDEHSDIRTKWRIT